MDPSPPSHAKFIDLPFELHLMIAELLDQKGLASCNEIFIYSQNSRVKAIFSTYTTHLYKTAEKALVAEPDDFSLRSGLSFHSDIMRIIRSCTCIIEAIQISDFLSCIGIGQYSTWSARETRIITRLLFSYFQHSPATNSQSQIRLSLLYHLHHLSFPLATFELPTLDSRLYPTLPNPSRTLLHHAASQLDLPLTKFLLAHGSSPSHPTPPYTHSLPSIAAITLFPTLHFTPLTALLDTFFNPSIPRPTKLAVIPDLLRLLVAHGASINEQHPDPKDPGILPLLLPFYYIHAEKPIEGTVEFLGLYFSHVYPLLLELGADLDATAVHFKGRRVREVAGLMGGPGGGRDWGNISEGDVVEGGDCRGCGVARFDGREWSRRIIQREACRREGSK